MKRKSVISTLILSVSAIASFAQDTTSMTPAPCYRSNAHIGFTYPLSTNGVAAPEFSNLFSAHALVGVSRAEEAFCVAGLGNIIRDSARGFVGSGVVNVIGGSARGMQAAGVVNYTAHSVRGMQAAGVVNVATDVDGFQASGFANTALKNVHGFQAAGFINVADSANVQASGFINVARHSNTQVAGFINVADQVEGAQVAGFINVARKVKGVQISGFINIADSSDCPIGLINIIRNGEIAVGMAMNETGTTLFTFRSGGKKLYGIIGAGGNFTDGYRAYATQAGLGMHIPVTRSFRFNAEATITTLTDFWWSTDIRTGVKFMPSIRFGCVELYAGPSFSYTGTNDIQGVGRVGYSVWNHHSYGYSHDLSIGAEGGIQFHLDSRKFMKKLMPEKNIAD